MRLVPAENSESSEEAGDFGLQSVFGDGHVAKLG